MRVALVRNETISKISVLRKLFLHNLQQLAMSLFTLTDIWSYDCHESNPHTFSHKSIIVGNIDNEQDGDYGEKVVLASYSGLLRVIGAAPRDSEDSVEEENNPPSPNRVNLHGTLLAELHLGAPILQIEAGYFLGLTDKLDLAILHPHRLGIYTITKLSGQVEHGSQYKVTLLHEHQLKRHAFNMCYGRFGSGGSSGKAPLLPTNTNARPEAISTQSLLKKNRRGRGKGEDLKFANTKKDMQLQPAIPTTATIKRKDFICVQSLDGTLSFFEQEVYTFSCYLPNFLLPGPLAYVSESDSFLTTSSSWELQSFKYSHLVALNDSSSNGSQEKRASIQTQETSLGKRLSPDWSFSLGEESICDIQVLTPVERPDHELAVSKSEETTTSNFTTRLVLATFRHLYCFNTTGELLWCKRLDFQMSCFVSFLNSANECITLATSIGTSGSSTDSGSFSETELGTLYIYSGTTLKWAAKLPFASVFVGKVQINDVPGGIVLLSARGQLMIECLGTEPSLFVAPAVESRDLDYEAAEQELASLRKIISAAGEQEIVASKDTTVEIKVEFEGQNSKWIESLGKQTIVLVATVKLVCRVRVNDVRVTVYTSRPIVCSQESVHIGDIVGRHTYSIEFYAENDAIPSDLACEIIVFYQGDNGIPHFIQKSGIRIPLFIITKQSPVVDKSGQSKLTFSINKPVLNLVSLYNDFEWSADAIQSSVTFQFSGGEKVTVLSSTKASNPSADPNVARYRIQSDVIAGIHLVFHDFLERLGRKYGRTNSDLEITIISGGGSEIPLLDEYFNEIEAHVLRRRREIQIRDDITDRAAQLRAIQRRLLVRFRDKNIAPLTHLETLLDGSLDHLMDVLNIMDQNELEKQKSESRLSGATKLMLELCLIQGKRKTTELTLLTNALCPYVSDFINDLGWEESIFTNISYLKTQQVVSCSTFAQLDSSKLKKIIKSTLAKIRQASQPLPSAAAKGKELSDENKASKNELLIGNEISERMTSARGKTARRRQAMTSNLDSIPEPDDGEVVQGNTRVLPETSEEEIMEGEVDKPLQKSVGSRKLSMETDNDVDKLTANHVVNGNVNQDDDDFW